MSLETYPRRDGVGCPSRHLDEGALGAERRRLRTGREGSGTLRPGRVAGGGPVCPTATRRRLRSAVPGRRRGGSAVATATCLKGQIGPPVGGDLDGLAFVRRRSAAIGVTAATRVASSERSTGTERRTRQDGKKSDGSRVAATLLAARSDAGGGIADATSRRGAHKRADGRAWCRRVPATSDVRRASGRGRRDDAGRGRGLTVRSADLARARVRRAQRGTCHDVGVAGVDVRPATNVEVRCRASRDDASSLRVGDDAGPRYERRQIAAAAAISSLPRNNVSRALARA